VFGLFRRTKGWLRRKKGWIYFGLAIAVLFVVRPVLTILAEIFKVLQPLVRTLLDNPVGRFVFYNVLAAVLLYWVWRKVRAGVLRVVGLRAMRAFLDGMHGMIAGRFDAAIPFFEKVERIGRRVRLEDVVPEHRDIRADARLKIAACHLRRGRPNEAKAWLLRVREQDILTDHVRRHHAELRALSYDLNEELEDETILRELERSQRKDSSNRRVLLALRDRLEASGNLDRTIAVARRLAAVSEGREKEDAANHLALLEFRKAHRALGEGDRRSSVKSLKANAGDRHSALLLGDVLLEAGDLKGALRAWSRAVSLPVFDRIAALLESGRLAGDREKEMLLRHFPYAGTMIALAEHYRKRGETRKAKAAIEKVLEAGGGRSATVLRQYALCLEAEGDAAGAADLYRRALTESVG
jgi:tetratricopeptide (TPR) repeat protein